MDQGMSWTDPTEMGLSGTDPSQLGLSGTYPGHNLLDPVWPWAQTFLPDMYGVIDVFKHLTERLGSLTHVLGAMFLEVRNSAGCAGGPAATAD